MISKELLLQKTGLGCSVCDEGPPILRLRLGLTHKIIVSIRKHMMAPSTPKLAPAFGE